MNLKTPISITGLASVSAMGSGDKVVLEAYQNPGHVLVHKAIGHQNVWIGQLPEKEREQIKKLGESDPKYRSLDNSVLYALYVSRKAIEQAGWAKEDSFGINIGSSRGATQLFEDYHKEFLEKEKTPTLTSPTTTLGNISSWVAHDLQSKGPVISHSITCSTAFHAILNGVAWIQSGLADKFLVGGSEAPLTPFTISQMQALKIYSKMPPQAQSRNLLYPCRAFDLKKRENTMVLGEGAAMACLEHGNTQNALAKIVGIGYATEVLKHNVSISAKGKCFQDSMRMALTGFALDEVDAIVMHAPGTLKGDLSEYEAIAEVFGDKKPFLTTNKWKIGHTFGASGMLSLEMTVQMLNQQQPFPVPFIAYQTFPKKMKKVLVNAVGFGGNAVSLLLSR